MSNKVLHGVLLFSVADQYDYRDVKPRLQHSVRVIFDDGGHVVALE